MIVSSIFSGMRQKVTFFNLYHPPSYILTWVKFGRYLTLLMANDPFVHIRKLEQAYRAGELPVAKTFEGDLLQGVTNPYLEQLAQLSPVEFEQVATESRKANVSLKRGDQLDWKLEIDRKFENLSSYVANLAKCQVCMQEGISSCNGTIVSELTEQFEIGIDVLFVGDIPRLGQESVRGDQVIEGESRELLDRMITAMKLDKDKFVITLAAKCLGQGDHDQREMLSLCKQNLLREILLLRPKVVITLGATATNSLLGREERLTNVHGKFLNGHIQLKECSDQWHFKIVPIFHPDYLLINPNMKRTAWIDMQKVISFLNP